MGIEAGKIAVIFDDDPRLAAVWKGKSGETKPITGSFPFSSGNSGGNNGGNPDPNISRPQLSDITLTGFETYSDSSNMQKVKAKFRIYNSSKEQVDGFIFALTKPDTQGGRA